MKRIYKGKSVLLDKPSRIKPNEPGYGRKKFKVYVLQNNRVKKIMFGDPNMRIKKNNPQRQKSFLARHKCSTAKNKTAPRDWSCLMWK